MHQRVAIDGCRMLCSHVDCRVPNDTTVPYIYVHSLIVVSLIAFYLSMHLVYMLTCRLSFSYLYLVYYILTCWLSCSYWCTRMHSALVDCRFPRCITYVYAQTLIVLYLQFLFQYPSINIDKCTCMHAKRNVLVMIRRIGVSSCLCCANDIVVTEEPDDIRI